MGVKRIILARELTGSEIKEMINRVKGVDFEIFVHGAMCVSYSGRCLLSNYLANRDSNRGECTQPCRWKYFLMEEKRPGEYIPVEEDEKEPIFNSKDLCLTEQIRNHSNGRGKFKNRGTHEKRPLRGDGRFRLSIGH